MSDSDNVYIPLIRLVGVLEAAWKEQAEELLFFNPRQTDLKKHILKSIQLYGIPKIQNAGANIRIVLGDDMEPGAVFALAEHDNEVTLAGLLLYVRRNSGLVCLYMSIPEDYTTHGIFGHYGIAYRLLDSVQKVGTRIHGVNHIEIYNRDCWYKVPLNRNLL